jgi:hypothetical protein
LKSCELRRKIFFGYVVNHFNSFSDYENTFFKELQELTQAGASEDLRHT